MSALFARDASGALVAPGDVVTSFRGEEAVLVRVTRPRELGRSGKVLVDWKAGARLSGRGEYYDGVFNLTTGTATVRRGNPDEWISEDEELLRAHRRHFSDLGGEVSLMALDPSRGVYAYTAHSPEPEL